jgi:hypothetical protein
MNCSEIPILSMMILIFFKIMILIILGAYSAINTCEQFRLCVREKYKFLSPQALMVLMAISIGGCTILLMHFVGNYYNFCFQAQSLLQSRSCLTFMIILTY